MIITLNDTELMEAVEKHCGSKNKSTDDKLCKRCSDSIRRSKIIKWQKNEMWHRYRAGYYDMSSEHQTEYENNRKQYLKKLREGNSREPRTRDTSRAPVR